MADDVVSFFKSKKSKKPGGHHGAAVQTADELARRLEITVQQQQALDRENGADAGDEDDYGNPIAAYSQQLSTGNNAAAGAGGGAGAEKNAAMEDSEWFDVDQEADIDLTKFGIKEMEITEDNESLGGADEESLANRKTWNINSNQAQKTEAKTEEGSKTTGTAPGDALPVDGAGVSVADSAKNEASSANEENEASKTESAKEPEVAAESKPAAYVPPSMRNKQPGGAAFSSSMRPGKKPNLEDAEEFPSLDVASKLEEEQEKTKKKKPPPPPFHKGASPSPASAWGTKRTTPVATDNKQPAAGAQAEPAQEPPAPKPNTYVPPHLRKK